MIPEPSSPLWNAVKKFQDVWPKDNEDTVETLARKWSETGQTVGIQPEAHAVIATVEDGHLADARHARQDVH